MLSACNELLVRAGMSCLTALTALHMRDNPLHRIPPALLQCKALQILDLGCSPVHDDREVCRL